MNDLSTMNKDNRPDVDALLGDFFRSEMPAPWPAAPLMVPQANRPRRVGSFWSRSSGRLALAASIALLVAGYLALSAYFPSRPANNGMQDMHNIGGKEPRGPQSDDDRPMPMD